jgi:UDP-3-O-[3-hydroxymyristoyl] glucosamine N-acyltransferase
MAKLGDLAKLVDGELIGDPGLEISSLGPIDSARQGQITFLANKKFINKIGESKASAIIVPPGIDLLGKPGIVTDNPYLAFAKVLTLLTAEELPALGVLEGSVVSPSAKIGEDATIFPGCYIGDNAVIGKGTVIHPNVVVYKNVAVGDGCVLHGNVVIRENCRVGNRVIIQPGAVIGSDGFGYAPDGASYYKIPQVGIVVLEDDVEIGAATCIDRAALGETRIKRGTKIDNLVQVAHNVTLGEDTILVSQVGIAGSTTVGNHCTFGGQVGIAGHVTIGDNVTIAARGAVAGNLKSNQVLSGAPVMDHREFLKATMTFPKLPEMRKELLKLQKKVAELESLLKEGDKT